MEWTFKVNEHDQWGDITEEGVYITFNDTASIKFDDPTDLANFLDSAQKTMDEIVSDWNNSVVDE